MKDKIAFFGYPNPLIIKKYKEKYKGAKWLDLDVDYGAPKVSILPENYCSIIRNIFNNAFFYKDEIIKIIAAVGRDKCDSALLATEILKDLGFDVEISMFEDTSFKRDELKISTSNLPLRKKVELITANIIDENEYSLEQIEPTAGFWGVPPNDLSILDIFPNSTHIFGWLRCVEKRSPYNLEIEKYVDKNLKTVFFAQTFCAKTGLARYLADKYNGLYVDADEISTNSCKTKIEAFLRLK